MPGTMTSQIAAVLDDPTKTTADRIEKLKIMRDDARAEQRAATEADMIDDDGRQDDLREIDLALQYLGYDPLAEIEDESAATL